MKDILYCVVEVKHQKPTLRILRISFSLRLEELNDFSNLTIKKLFSTAEPLSKRVFAELMFVNCASLVSFNITLNLLA